MLERFLCTKETPWKMNKLQCQTKAYFQAAIEDGAIVLDDRDICLCGSCHILKIASLDRFGLDFSSYICKSCGLIFTTPYICDSSLPLYYNNFYHPLHFGSAKVRETLFSKGQGTKIFNFVKPYLHSSDIKIFEMGAGCGTNLLDFAAAAKTYNIKVACYGNEYSKNYVRYGNKKGLRLTSNSIQEYVNKTKDRFDLIIMSHVFEHVTDPFDTLQCFKKISHQGTILYIEVPGVLDLKTRYGYNCDFLRYLTHAHNFNFSLSSLKAILNQCGFELVRGNEKVESIFQMNRDTGSSFARITNDNYREILLFLMDLEANLTFYQSKNPANSMRSRIKRTIKYFAKKLMRET